MIGRKPEEACDGGAPACARGGGAGDGAPGLWVVVSEPRDVPGREEWDDEFQCGVHGAFDREDAADRYALLLSKLDGTRAYGALRCPAAGVRL